jgi:uncharacterized protein (DUF2249 family)
MMLAGLLPIRFDPKRSSRINECLKHLSALCDVVFVLSDNSPAEYINKIRADHPEIFSWTIIESKGPVVWNDWSNRAILLLEAARNGYEWVFWIDHDETFWPMPNRERVDEVISEARSNPSIVCVRYPWLQLWNDMETVRVDGFWSQLKKPFLQKNPFLQNLVSWPVTCRIPLHTFPIQHGATLLKRDFAILHSGLMSREEREYRVAKYRSQDPSGKTDDMFMNALESESEAVTVKLRELRLDDLPD